MRRHDGWDRMRRPRVWFAATPPGGPGSPSAPTTWGRLQWLDAAWMKGGESCLDTVGRPSVCARKHGPGDRKAAMERRVAKRACRKGTSTPQGVLLLEAPHGAPSPRMGEGNRKTGLPGASTKNAGDDAWLFEIGCLTIESVRDVESATHSAHSRPRLRGDRLQRESSAGSPLLRGRAAEGRGQNNFSHIANVPRRVTMQRHSGIFGNIHVAFHLHSLRHAISGKCATACAMRHLRRGTAICSAARTNLDNARGAREKPHECFPRIRHGSDRHWLAAVIRDWSARGVCSHARRQRVVGLHRHA